MYGFPADFDPAVLVGGTLDVVSHAQNLIGLDVGEIRVTAYGSLWYRTSSDGEEQVDTPPVARTELVALVGRTVTSARLVSPRRLELQLDEGSVTLLDDSDEYESYTLRGGGLDLVV